MKRHPETKNQRAVKDTRSKHRQRNIKELARAHKANTELQHQVDTLKHEFNNFRTNSTYYNLSSLQVPGSLRWMCCIH